MSDPLLSLLALSEQEKKARGLTFTPHEIFQQPETWKSTYRNCVERAGELKTFLAKSAIGSSHPPVVFLVGAGTSDYVGRALAPLLRRRWQCDVWAVPSTDLLTGMDDMVTPGRTYFWITFSRSGDSPEGVAVLEKALANHPQIRHLVITCNQDGRMAQLGAAHRKNSRALVLDSAVNDRGLAMTSSFTNMLLAGQCLANLDKLEEFGATVERMSEVAARFLDKASKCAAEIAAMGCSKACFVGSGSLAGVADESALKVLELTSGKIHTMAESVLGLRHGPMSALDKDSLFVLFLSGSEKRRPYEIDLLKEVREKKLGKIAVVVTPRHYDGIHEKADRVLSLDAPAAITDEYLPAIDIIFAQLLGLFSSLQAGLQPDRPSPNGAISRVVSHVNIY